MFVALSAKKMSKLNNTFIVIFKFFWGCEKIWEGDLNFCVLLHFYDPLLKSLLRGVYEVPPSSPSPLPPCLSIFKVKKKILWKKHTHTHLMFARLKQTGTY